MEDSYLEEIAFLTNNFCIKYQIRPKLDIFYRTVSFSSIGKSETEITRLTVEKLREEINILEMEGCIIAGVDPINPIF